MIFRNAIITLALLTAPTLAFGQAGPGPGPVPSPVSSVFNRTGIVTAQTGDYNFSQVSGSSTTSQLPLGTSVGDPGTGTLNSLVPVQTVTGTSKTFATTDLFKKTRRSNSGVAMTDTFPAATATGIANGTQINIVNFDATASDTITAGTGTTLNGNSTFVVGPGRDVWWSYDLANTAWRPIANTASALLGPNNLSDVSNVATARTNLGLGSAALKTATSSGVNVASTSGSFTTGHVLVTADTNGTVQDGGVPTLTINSVVCTLASSCTITAAATGITAGITTIGSGTPNGLLYDAAGVLGNLATANNGVLVTSSGGVPSVSTTLPSGIAAANMVLTTPALGTPSSATLTNATGLPVTSGISGLGTGVATFLATPSSANLASAVTGATGSGALVFGTSPTLTSPVLGTPTSVTLTNATGLPVSTGISGLGAGVATFLATPSSANLASAVTGATGSGALVFGTSPTLASPTMTGTATLPGSASWSSAGLTVNGTYTTASTSIFNITSTFAPSATAGAVAFTFNPTISPSGASATAIYNNGVLTNLASSSTPITTLAGTEYTFTEASSYTGTITNASHIRLLGPSVSGNPITNWAQIYATGNGTNGNGVTSGTIANYNMQMVMATAAAGSGGTVNNVGYGIIGGGGTGGAGTTINDAFLNTTSWQSQLNGPLILAPSGTAASNAVSVASGEFALGKITATGTAPGAGYLKLEAVTGTNTGTCKIIAYAGTSTTPSTILDNIGGGC